MHNWKKKKKNLALYPSILEPQNHRSLLINPTRGEPCLLEVVGDFKAMDPIFKWCYRDSLLYSKADLAWLRWQKVYLPMFQWEIPMPPAPSYGQDREPAVTKQSLHRAAALDTSVKSTKAKYSSSKGRPTWGSRRSSNTSTPKHSDSMSTNKPSCPKESTPDNQAKSPQARSSHKCSCSPSPASGSAGCKWRDLHRVDSSMADTTLPISSNTLDTFCSLMGSLSNMIEPLAPAITSTPLGKAGPREGQMTSSDSRHSSASLFASSSCNLPGYPSMGLGSLTPLVPSIASSHHILSTWPPNLFPSGPSTPWLTIDQANSIFGLASECLALSIRLAKDFQVLSGLEAIHCNSVQGMAHEMLTLIHSTREATYMAILQDDITEVEREAMTRRLHSEADVAWKKMHEVMYNHQLEYDRWLTDFLKEAEMMLANMRDQIWTAVHALMESKGVTFENCLNLMLHILLLLLQIHMDVSYQTDTAHHCLLPGVFGLQKMALWTRQSVPPPWEGQSIPDPDQGVGQGPPPRNQGSGLCSISRHLWRLCGIRWAARLPGSIMQPCPKCHLTPQLVIRLCLVSGH